MLPVKKGNHNYSATDFDVSSVERFTFTPLDVYYLTGQG